MIKSSSRKRILVVFLSVMMILLAIPVVASADTTNTIPLYAGQTTLVGEVVVSNVGDQLTVTYSITADDWYLTETHTYIGTTPPPKNAPGKFPYKHEGIYTKTDEVTATITVGTQYFIAAHAVVVNEDCIEDCDCPTLGDISSMLPVNGNFILQSGDDDDSKFIINITNDGFLNGIHPAWCIDRDHGIYYDLNYYANFYSSYGTIPDWLTSGSNPNIDYPGNLDLVNWVINNHGGYKSWETQNVIWNLIDANPPLPLSGNELDLYNAAIANGEDFEPNFCEGEVIGIIAEPITCAGEPVSGQALLLELSFECDPTYQEETAWAQGNLTWTKSRNWGSYFSFTPTNDLD